MKRFAKPVALALLAVAASPAHSETTHTIDIAAGTLGDAISALGIQTEASIGTTDSTIARAHVDAVRGRLTIEKALAKLLRGHNVRAIRIDAGHWRLVRLPQVAAEPEPARPATLAPSLPTAAPEIIVTASKRNQPLSHFPGSATILDARAFAFSANHSNTDTIIANAVSLTSTNVGDGRNKLFIRGVADASFIGAQQATVGQYFGDMRLNYSAPDPDLRLIDVRSVEILEGPQGTLYGAGSLGGIIRTDANPPQLSRFDGEAGVSASLTAHGDPSGDGFALANIPIVTDRLGVRLVGYAGHQGGYIDDVSRGIKDVNDTEIKGGRAMIRAKLASDWTSDITLIGQETHGNDSQYAERSRPRLTRKSAVAQGHDNNYGLANLRVSGAIGAMRLVSSTGIVRHHLTENYDGTNSFGIRTRFKQKNRISQFTSENRLSRDYASGASWMIGASYLESNSDVSRSLIVADTEIYTIGTRNQLREWALFGEATVPLTPWAQLTAGGRVSVSRLRGATLWPGNTLVSQDYQRRTETVVLPSIGLMTTPTQRLGAFLRYQQGFRPGGIALDGFSIAPYRNDRMAAFEAGLRYGDLDHDIFAATGSFSYTNWKDIQAGVFEEGSEPVSLNIGNGRILSAEAHVVVRPTPRLTFDMAVIYTHAKVTQPNEFILQLLSKQVVVVYDPATSITPVDPLDPGQTTVVVGQPIGTSRLMLPYASSPSALFSVTYRVPLSPNMPLMLHARARYVGKARLDVSPDAERPQGGYVDTELLARLQLGRTSFYINVENLLDSLGNRFGAGAPYMLFTGDQFTPLRPRTITIGASRSF